jgi:hypothetical protein
MVGSELPGGAEGKVSKWRLRGSIFSKVHFESRNDGGHSVTP